MKVIDFINHFTNNSEDKYIIEALSGDYSYWFASIIYKRFIREQAAIVFDMDTKSFGTKINGRVYDIKGDVTDLHKWVLWQKIPENIQKKIKNEQNLF